MRRRSRNSTAELPPLTESRLLGELAQLSEKRETKPRGAAGSRDGAGGARASRRRFGFGCGESPGEGGDPNAWRWSSGRRSGLRSDKWPSLAAASRSRI